MKRPVEPPIDARWRSYAEFLEHTHARNYAAIEAGWALLDMLPFGVMRTQRFVDACAFAQIALRKYVNDVALLSGENALLRKRNKALAEEIERLKAADEVRPLKKRTRGAIGQD